MVLLFLVGAFMKRAANAQERAREAEQGSEHVAVATKRAPSRGPAARRPQPPPSISIGRHNRGRLENGRELVASETIRIKHPEGDQHHGTDELVSLIEHGARSVAEQFPGSQLTVGDLSRRRGGRMRPHRSHRSGRDVDIGFYIVDTQGELVYLQRFVDFRADGTTRANPEWRFDDARNWALVAALVSQSDTPVQYIFAARWLRQRLLDHAASIGAPAEVIERAAALLEQPRRGGRHDDHFHVRIYCPMTDQPRCLDDPPWRPWVERPSAPQMAELRAADRVRRAARSRRAEPRSGRRSRH